MNSCSINSYIGASCMLIMLQAIWPSLKTYPNALPASAGITSNRMIAYLVFWTRESILFVFVLFTDIVCHSPAPSRPHSSSKDEMAVLHQVNRRSHRCLCPSRLVRQDCRRWWTYLRTEVQAFWQRQELGLGFWYQHCHLR